MLLAFILMWNINSQSYFLKEQGVDISKLALHFTLGFEEIPTTLVSTASIQNLQKNIDAVNQKLTEAERSCLQYIREKYVAFFCVGANCLKCDKNTVEPFISEYMKCQTH